MKKSSSSEAAFFNLRIFLATLLCLAGLSIGWFSLSAAPARETRPTMGDAKTEDRKRIVIPNANPASGTLNPGGPNVTWTGTATGGASLDESTCGNGIVVQDGINCDTFTLTLSGTPASWSGQVAHIVIAWPNANDDYDVFIHKGSNSGPLVGSSAQGGAGPETVDLDPSNPTIGTGVFTVHVVYFLAPTPLVTGQYGGTASAVTGGNPTPTPTPPGATPTPSPTPSANQPNIPRYQNYYPATGVADDAGEPSLGINWNTEETHTNNRASDGAVNPPIPNGGTSNYYGGFLTYLLRARFDDCASPAIVDFQQKTVTLPAAPRAAGDPILFTDSQTGRTFVSQLLGLTPAGSTMEFTDNDGDSFTPSEGGAPSGVDHQTIGGGPFHAPLPSLPTGYPNAVYYASQSIADATSQTSVDGGITFPAQTPMYTAAQCAGLHGHLKVAPDGTAFVPNKACVAPGGGIPLLNGGEAAVVVSEDNGITWTVRTIPNETTTGNDDPAVGVSICRPNDPTCDKAARSNTIYLGYQADTPTGAHPKIAVSHNKGQTWQNITDIGAIPGMPVINQMAFPEVVVGDPDRAAFAFFGSSTPGTNSEDPGFPGDWFLYIATTVDGGLTWNVVNASPGDPIQRNSGICGDGTCRNLLDFFDIQVDKEGRILIGGEDGCIGGCVNGGPNSFTAKAFITRQSGGRRLFANFDPIEPAIPGAPLVSGTLSGTTARLTWPEPDSGGAAITAYKIYKNASFTPIATVMQRSYDATGYVVGDTYRVTAVNAQGESPYCHNIVPSGAFVATPCVLPGVLVSNDLTQAGTDDDSGQNTPVDPRVNARQLFVAEPFIGAGVENFIFTLQVAPSTTNAPPANSQWIILWNRQGTQMSDPNDAKFDRLYLAMVSDAAGSLQFEYGKFGIPINTSPPPLPDPDANAPTKYGNADSGSYDPITGIIRITLSKSKLRAIDGGAGKYVPGTDLAATNVRTYFNRPDYNSDPNSAVRSQRSQNNASDITADGTYSIVGNASCAPVPQLVQAVSRKTHGPAGPFDLKLAPLVPANTVAIESRNTGDNTHQVVFVFAAPVTFTGATVTPGNGGTASVASTSPVGTPTSEVAVNLSNVSNAQTITVNLLGVTTGGASVAISAQMGLLHGDCTSSRLVDSGDLTVLQQQNLKPAAIDNFIDDVNASGLIDSGDLTVVQNRNLTFLP